MKHTYSKNISTSPPIQVLHISFYWNRDIRKKGRNKLHALRCRQRQREEVRLLQERVQRETETRRRLMETHEQVGARGARVYCDTRDI